MTRARRWATALLLCGVVVGLSPGLDAAAEPAPAAEVGSVVADLGVVTTDARPGFSHDGAYYAYLAPAGDRCAVRLYDVRARRAVGLADSRVVCDGRLVSWAAAADTLVWQVNAAAGDISVHAWDAGAGTVSLLAADARVFGRSAYEIRPQVSADGRFLAFTGRSATRPAPAVDAPRTAAYVYDRDAGVSLPLSTSTVHVDFQLWGPVGHRFTAGSGGRTPYDETGACFGSGTSCRIVPDLRIDLGSVWSKDAGAVIVDPGSPAGNRVYDFADETLTTVPTRAGAVDYATFVGPDADRVLALVPQGTAIWDRRNGTIVRVSDGRAYPSPTGRYLLAAEARPDAYRYRNLTTGAAAPATFRGAGGAWTGDGASFLGVGPGGCSSLRQWSPATNTVSLFGPPPPRTCFEVAQGSLETPSASSASGRFALVNEVRDGAGSQGYLADLRRHTLLGPLDGYVRSLAPAGTDVAAVARSLGGTAARLRLVDLTPVPDVDDKPRWSPPTPPNGTRVEAAAGGEVHVQLGASDLQGTPVNLYFRWRDTQGTPIASAPKGWSCERRRLAGGATVADCTFAPPRDFTATRFLDVSVTNAATGAQSDTRAYRVSTS